MPYRAFFIVVLIYMAGVCQGQAPANKMLFIIDSIPLLHDPEKWNQIMPEDIADMNVVKNRDSLKLLGWKDLDGITYVFTKEYRNRPDSLKKIPGLKQMEMKNSAWHFHGVPYTGKYIDYYNNGKKQNEGMLLNGRLNGALIIYFRNGNTKLTGYYKQGLEHGRRNEYYKNGALMQSRNFLVGKDDRTGKTYFINGQVDHELRLKKKPVTTVLLAIIPMET